MAYIATHGYFKEKELREEMQRWQERVHGWTFTSSRSLDQLAPLLLGQRSPLAYTGLALRKANTSKEGILSGDVIAELELEQLRLVILSSCMTGLGKHTVGEGVQATQRVSSGRFSQRRGQLVGYRWQGYRYSPGRVLRPDVENEQVAASGLA